MKIPFKYILRNFRTRRLTTGITVVGIALVVFVFAAVLMMAYGVQKTLVATGSMENVLVARKAANGEISSIILASDYNNILTLPHIAKTPAGAPVVLHAMPTFLESAVEVAIVLADKAPAKPPRASRSTDRTACPRARSADRSFVS